MQKYDVAAYIWPAYTAKEPRTWIFWPDGPGEWQTVKMTHTNAKHDYIWDRKPLWGYLDEADPKVMEMQIEEAVKHGVNTFIYDWYWFDDRPFLENCLNDGFLKAPNNKKMKFYLMWANHDATYCWDHRISSRGETVVWRGDVTQEQFHKIGRRWIDQYFTLDNYYKIDGKPLVSIYDLGNFINGLGGIEKAKENMDWLQREAKKAGLPGVHFQLIKWGEQNLNLSSVDGGLKPVDPALVEPLGFASFTHYQIAHFLDVNRDYLEIIEDMKKEWNKVIATYHIPYSPHVSIGWDNNPRYIQFRPQIVKNNTPENFEKALREVKAFADKHCTIPLITINSWNEWTETSYLEPDNLYGYGYLEAVKRVFVDEE